MTDRIRLVRNGEGGMVYGICESCGRYFEHGDPVVLMGCISEGIEMGYCISCMREVRDLLQSLDEPAEESWYW